MAGKDEVKAKLDIVDYIGSQIQLKRAGRNFRGLCPFHHEKSPSFHVSSERQMFKCFGCGKSGDIFTFYQEREGVSFFEALKDLAKQAGVELDSFQPSEEFNQRQRLLELNIEAAKLFHLLLTQHNIGNKAMIYLGKRGVSTSQIKEFKLGYAPDGWRTGVDYLIRKKSFKPEEIEAVGLAIKSSSGWYDRFRGRIMFPLTDHRGNIVGFSGRILPDLDDGKSGKYINTPETSLYHKSQLLFPLYYLKDRIRDEKSVVVVEGEFDVLSSVRANISNVVAVKGSALTGEQVTLLKRYCDTVILSLDADSAGVAAAKRAITTLQAQEMAIKVVEIPKGKDPDELASTDPKAWREAVKGAVNIYDFFLDIALRTYDHTSIDGKKAIAKELIPIFAGIENIVERSHYRRKLADVLNMAGTELDLEMERVNKKAQLHTFKPDQDLPAGMVQISRKEMLLDEMLSLLIHNWEQIYMLGIDEIPLFLEDFPSSAVTQIIKEIKSQNPQNILVFADKLPTQLQTKFNDSFLAETRQMESDKLISTMENIQASIAKMELRDRLNKLRRDLTSTPNEQRSQIEQQINDVLLRFRVYK